MEIAEILDFKFLGNTVLSYLYFLMFITIGSLIVIPLSSYLLKFLFKFFGKGNNQKNTDKFNSLLKKEIPIKRVNNGVIPLRTAATEESIAVSAYANKNVGKKVPK